MVRWMVVAIAAVVGLMGEARAYSERVTPVALKWEQLPRTGVGANAYEGARIRDAYVVYSGWENGDRAFDIVFDNGVRCGVVALGRAVANLSCGINESGHYRLNQSPGQQTRLVWVERVR